MSETLAQLNALRANTDTTGILHEAQITQMKYWILGMIPESDEVSVEFNHKQCVIYRVKAKSLKFKQKKKRLSLISRWTQELLGDSYLIEIFINGSAIFNSDVEGTKSEGNKDS